MVIGGGPAGLTAAIYLARFHLSVGVFEDGRSRAAQIPLARNHAGHPGGIPGAELLARMRKQAEDQGARIIPARAEGLAKQDGFFHAETTAGPARAEKALLATGVRNLRPDMPEATHAEALARGLLRYCPVCDAYEVTDRDVALLGTGEHALGEARFLRSFTARVTLVAPYGQHRFGDEQEADRAAWGIAALDGPVDRIALEEDRIALTLRGQLRRFDTLYAALGTAVRSELARAIGAQTSADGAVLVDRHQMTSVEGLYAAGDVVKGLDQIGNAMGQAGIAATAMRNAICAARPLRR